MSAAIEEELKCPICFEIAENAMETSCCHKLFCLKCLAGVGERSCPNCRRPYQAMVSHFARRLINTMPVECPLGCGQTPLTRGDLPDHNRLCVKRVFQCPAPDCDFQGARQTFVAHLSETHTSALIDQAEKLFETPGQNIESLDRVARTTNSNGDAARLGETGKYYCSQPLNGSCSCCNGFCGPTNGCNCTPCMKLDVSRRRLPHGWLVNRKGFSARVGPETGRFYCGRKVMPVNSSCDGYCGPTNGPNCEACRKLDRQARDRYMDVWE
ncbi:E3 ubiquitin-protein ligase SINA-like 4 [Lingula anatina]|uniref:E3 ubiquitin-protein ligase SINA-like 4 n=1 Tax=Lingula anatina TaxID=7574 RepID=A0A1S3HYN6_LINAN|nr:E3 ubiquitin-protein ligase SINA-like 4 [Lingula anatina]XP_013391123.1 E3 ubiquitin-protein ligase SINA-like 4 [Lingula anatina]XP_013391124.1 E3 ubiquitin-protein ligase SINA-like 4 [Lingula anatina]XP_013391125.1 E3 ubiquitin-protein ligase SINA-like 4 [Lingula anatina]|eukprot:XP_013391120.1 E3 ubiquitin-protein ligase SINA-like 4 [Lingula anatina]